MMTPIAANPNESLTITQAARLLGCSAQSLRLWEMQGKIRPSYRTIGGGHRRYYRKDIEALIARRDAPPAPPPPATHAETSSHEAQPHHAPAAG